MSCMISSHDTINAVVHALDLDGACNPRHNLSTRMEVSDGKYADLGDLIGRELIVLNLKAYKERYKLQPETPGFSWRLKRYTKYELWKACKFFLYQCSEGDDIMQHPTYKRVEKAINLLSDNIIHELPEVKAIPWGLDETGQCYGPGNLSPATEIIVSVL